MSFVTNDANLQQLSFTDSFHFLTSREQRILEKSWAKYFAEKIFPKIDEKPYAVLYSQKDSRPNTPVNVQIGALIIKEFTGQSDDEIFESLLFDVRYQYALHTTSMEEQPMSDRTLGRFRQRCATYEEETGIDLLHDTMTSLADEMAALMQIDRSLKRMDSFMVASNIKKMSRLELLYTCVANLVKAAQKREMEIPAELSHYLKKEDRNEVIYHSRSEDTLSRIQKVLAEAKMVKDLCDGNFDDVSEYQLLIRVLKEQAVMDEGGNYHLKEKNDKSLNASILQNPADPEATYREKAGKQNRGYVANITEECGENGSIITDYQYEQNIHSDSQFMKETLKAMEKQEAPVTIVTDGAYSGEGNENAALEKNVALITTNLTGRETPDIYADFEFSEDGRRITRCPGGYAPKGNSYNQNNGQVVASFDRLQCEGCPYKGICKPKMNKKTCRKTLSARSKERAEKQRFRKTEEFKKLASFRNGVETVPSVLRRKYGIDHMPVRGKIRTRFLLGCKIGALNFKKLCRYLQSQDKCAPEIAPA
ncbi:MAG: transposase [Blautia sp.]|nr:transposase [Blautia sp.]